MYIQYGIIKIKIISKILANKYCENNNTKIVYTNPNNTQNNIQINLFCVYVYGRIFLGVVNSVAVLFEFLCLFAVYRKQKRSVIKLILLPLGFGKL